MKKITLATLGMGLLLASCGNTPTASAPTVSVASPAATATTPQPQRVRLPGELAPLVNAGAEDAIPGQYIAVLSEGSAAANAAMSAQGADGLLDSLGLSSEGVEIQNIYSQALQGFSAQLSAQALEQLRANPTVKYVEQDIRMYANGTESNATWGLDRVDQRDLPFNNTYNYAEDGTGVLAFVLDSGVRISHQEFGGRAIWGTNTTGDGVNADCQGHGTHVAGTVAGATKGVAQNVRLVSVKVLGCDGAGSNSAIIAGMDWTVNYGSGRKVLNMSLGPRIRATSQAFTDAVNRLYNRNIITVVAGGNSNDDSCYYSPADAPNAITVGATDRYDRRSDFSNYGTCVDIFAPGSDIVSAGYSSDTSYATKSGTSMAAPHTAGAVALLLQKYPTESAAQITARLLNNATSGKISDVMGSPNRLLFTGASSTTAPAPTNPEPGSTFTGYVSQGGSSFQPGVNGVQTSGTLIAELSGPVGTDFDLYLQRLSNGTWVDVAKSENAGSTERISYNAAAGTYRLEVYGYSGSGSYTLKTN